MCKDKDKDKLKMIFMNVMRIQFSLIAKCTASKLNECHSVYNIKKGQIFQH